MIYRKNANIFNKVKGNQRQVNTVASVDVNCPDTRTVGKPTDPARLELTTMPFAGICSTTELRIHDEFANSVATR